MLLLETGDTISGQAGAVTSITATLYGRHVGVSPELKKLYQGQVPNVATLLYTVPPGVQAELVTIILVNTSGGAVTIKLWHDGTADSNVILPAVSLAAGEFAVFGADGWRFYTAAGAIK